MPTEMKKTAPKRSFTGFTTRSIRSASGVPARIDPMTNAPNANEKPLSTEKIAIKKHNPIAIMSIISSLITSRNRLKSVGMRKTPTTNQIIKKNPNCKILFTISPPDTVLLMAIDDNITIITTANRSSTIRTANTPGTKRRWRRLRSVNALRMIVVDDIESMAPRKMLLTVVNPILLPTTKPVPIMPSTIISAVDMALPPALMSFLKLNSSPNENNSTMIPICAQNSMFSPFPTEGTNEKCGLAIKPATM